MKPFANFLSDLCGREETNSMIMIKIMFLSDLCGREEYQRGATAQRIFLSDLCGREEVTVDGYQAVTISKRPVRS